MAGDIRQFGISASSVRSAGYYGSWPIRIYHLFIAYPSYSVLTSLLVYVLAMDTILFFKIRSRGPMETIAAMSNGTNSDPFQGTHGEPTTEIDIFASLPVKKIMVGPTVSFLE